MTQTRIKYIMSESEERGKDGTGVCAEGMTVYAFPIFWWLLNIYSVC